ncbi:MAG TPA: tRNA lysidine(34) synthetase TilS [Actinomycetota bacterium]|nr:tRNA lysidine(34) synthetase TilS [Actinomycetota bacterium]
MAGASRQLTPGLAGPVLIELATKVSETIRAHQLMDKEDRVLVALSGGADSTALALILNHAGYEIVLGHVDHGMRPDSEQDFGLCSSFAERLEVPISYERLDPAPGTEEEARDARYEALEQMAESNGCAGIAVGHTFDDQAETVLMRKRRGGLALGMPYRRGRVVRPILGLKRAETEAVCREAGVQYLTDPTNAEDRYTRNRVRKELTHVDEETIKGLVEEGARNFERVAGTAALVESFLAEHVRETETMRVVNRPSLLELEPSLRRQVMRALLGEFGAQGTRQLFEDIESKAVATGVELNFAPGLSIWTEGDDLVVGELPQKAVLPDLEIPAGQAVLSEPWGLSITADYLPAPSSFGQDPLTEYVQLPRTDSNLTLRQWGPGDSFHPLGAPGRKKLHDFFIDERVPRRKRDRVPIITSKDGIVWVVGLRIDEKFKVADRSAPTLRLRAAWLSAPLL